MRDGSPHLRLVPVVLRGRPETSACSSAGEPTTSKPWRPRMCVRDSVARFRLPSSRPPRRASRARSRRTRPRGCRRARPSRRRGRGRRPSQPRWPTYGGTKNRSGSASTSICCMPSAAAHQIAKRPSPWWSVSTITNGRLPRTKKVGAPWLRRSVVSGRPRQISRIRSSVRSRSAWSTTSGSVAHRRWTSAGDPRACQQARLRIDALRARWVRAPPPPRRVLPHGGRERPFRKRTRAGVTAVCRLCANFATSRHAAAKPPGRLSAAP